MIKKNPLFTLLAPLVVTLLFLMLMSYLMSPTSDIFQWSSLNPLTPLAGILFLLSFGAGVPIWLAALLTLTLLGMLYVSILKFLQLIIHYTQRRKRRK